MKRVPAKVTVPSYVLGVALVAVGLVLFATIAISVRLADDNARELVQRYEADKAATAEANRRLYCALFASQVDAYEEAQSPVGEKAYQAWLDLYRLARCTPAR